MQQSGDGTSKSRCKATQHAIGYIRVSTEKQAEGNESLGGQAESIIEWCRGHGFTLDGIFEDVSSGRGPQNLARRSGLMDAVKQSEAHGIPIVVVRIDRFSRDVSSFTDLVGKRDISIIAVSENGVVSGDVLLQHVKRAEVAGNRIALDTSDALQRKKARGAVLGSPGDKSAAGNASGLARKKAAHAFIEDLAGMLSGEPGLSAGTAQEIADILNKRGILSGQKKQWTLSGIRRPLRLARKELAIRKEIEDEPDDGSFLVGNDLVLTVKPRGFGAFGNATSVANDEGALLDEKLDADVEQTAAEQEAELAAFRKVPNYGRF